MQAFSENVPSGPIGAGTDNFTLCPWELSNHPANGYTPTAYTRCRLVVDRDGRRTNTAAHLLLTGASANELAVLEVRGVAGRVTIAVAGENLRALVAGLSSLLGGAE